MSEPLKETDPLLKEEEPIKEANSIAEFMLVHASNEEDHSSDISTIVKSMVDLATNIASNTELEPEPDKVEVEEEVEEELEEKVEEEELEVEEVEEKVEEVVEEVDKAIEKAIEKAEKVVEKAVEEPIKVAEKVVEEELIKVVEEVEQLIKVEEAIKEVELVKSLEELELIVTIDLLTQKKPEVKTLVELAGAILASNDLQDKYAVKLSEPNKRILLTIIKKNPQYFASIEETFKAIIQDNKIDAKDTHNIIVLLTKLYEILVTSKLVETKLSAETCGSILKFIFSIIIQEKLVVVKNDVEMLTCLDCLIDSCIKLIALSNTAINTPEQGATVSSLFGCLHGLFK